MNVNGDIKFNLDFKKLKLPKSPTALVLGLTVLAIVGIGAWTGYTYFFASTPVAPAVTPPVQYYNDELKRISTALERYDTYQITFSDADIQTGKDDPFQSQ
jgi:hypothetical protein